MTGCVLCVAFLRAGSENAPASPVVCHMCSTEGCTFRTVFKAQDPRVAATEVDI